MMTQKSVPYVVLFTYLMFRMIFGFWSALWIQAVASLNDAEGHQLRAEGHRGLERRRRENRGAEGAERGGDSPLPRKFFF